MTPDSVPLPSGSGDGEASHPPETRPDSAGQPVLSRRFGPGVVDGLFVAFVTGLAFLLALVPARNSDLWLHLASGRLLAQGRGPGGTDPFTSTAGNQLWVNPTWLSDQILFVLYTLDNDGKILVVAKACFVATLAGLLFWFRRRGEPLGGLILVSTVAAVALAPWLALGPTLVSLLGLVLTLFLLERPALVEAERAARAFRMRWFLLPLFALWANLDRWFFLGPLLVALYALGELFTRRGEGNREGGMNVERPHLPARAWASGLLALGSVAACLLTPYHYHLFTWPPPLGLSHTERVLMEDPLGSGLVVSPFSPRFAASPPFASPGAWAYYLLLAGGLASFLLPRRAIHPGRLLAWLALAGLSVYQANAIPFFTVVAAPILALNWQEWARTAPLPPTWGHVRRAARGIGLLLAPALLVLAWIGWLQPAPYRARGWWIEPDGSLARLTGTLRRWHAEGKFRPDRFALTFSPEASQYLAWSCPREKGFLDSRWPLFNGVADDFVRMRRCLLDSNGGGPDPALGPLLDAHKIDRIILHDPDFRRTFRAYQCLVLGGSEWELLALEGGSALFGRRSSQEASSSWRPLDLRHAAYHSEPDQRAPQEAPRPPRPPLPFDAFSRPRDLRSPDRAEADLLLRTFDLKAQRQQARLGTQWLAAQATGLLGPAAAPRFPATAGILAVRLTLTPLGETGTVAVWGQDLLNGFLARRDRGPSEVLLLTVRAARRALAANPDDAAAFLILGEAYVRLAKMTREQAWYERLPLLAAVRRTQALTSLEQAVVLSQGRGELRPLLDQAHARLAQLYVDTGQLDQALAHARARLELGPRPADEQTALRASVTALEEEVRRRQAIYDANAPDPRDPSKVYERARLAFRHGLRRKALDLLLASHPAVFGKPGVILQLDLMLQAGRAYEVRAWLEPEHEAVLGFSTYHWFQAQAAAACGDYRAADTELDLWCQEKRHVAVTETRSLPVRTAMTIRVAEAVLSRPARGSGPGGLAGALFFQFNALGPLGGPAGLLRQEADVYVLRGLLALEAGVVQAARGHFRQALALADPQRAGVDFAARPVAEEVLERMKDEG